MDEGFIPGFDAHLSSIYTAWTMAHFASPISNMVEDNKFQMYTILVSIHGLLRWLILLVAVIGLGRTLLATWQRSTWSPMDRGLSAGYAGLIDLQVLIGVILLLWDLLVQPRSLGLALFLHPILMLLAAGAAHMNRRYRNAANDADKFRGQLSVYAISLVLILVGIYVITSLVPGSV